MLAVTSTLDNAGSMVFRSAARATHGIALLQKALQLTGVPSSEVNVLADMGNALANSPVAGLPQQQCSR